MTAELSPLERLQALVPPGRTGACWNVLLFVHPAKVVTLEDVRAAENQERALNMMCGLTLHRAAPTTVLALVPSFQTWWPNGFAIQVSEGCEACIRIGAYSAPTVVVKPIIGDIRGAL